jgi:hypothetical protein
MVQPKVKSRCHVTTDGQSVCRGVEPTLGLVTRYYSLSEGCCLVSVGRPLSREVGSAICHSQSVVIYQYLHEAFTLHVFYSSSIYIQYTHVEASFSPVSIYRSLCSTGSLLALQIVPLADIPQHFKNVTES